MTESGFPGELKMDLSPAKAPVYGGGVIEIGLFGDLEIPELSRLFLVFDGSKQRQVTEARVVNGRRLQAVIPDHEPPEIVALSLIVKHTSNGLCRTIAQHTFTYLLDQTCYLARYLADSVHDLEGLEDWDYIRGPHFCLANEDFPTLDERLTSAFQHLILPNTWNLLGDASTAHVPRETLFHFAARLGLSSFVTLLLEKSGAAECLGIRNKHNELAQDIARNKSYNGLADLITDPHAHGVIRWETTHHITPSTTIKQHSFGTVTMSSDMHDGDFPPIEQEIAFICTNHEPPPPSKAVLDEAALHNGLNQNRFSLSDDLEMSDGTANATWNSEDVPPLPVHSMIEYDDDRPPPVPPKPMDLYEDDISAPPQIDDSSYLSPDASGVYTILDETTDGYEDEGVTAEGVPGILDDNLRELQKIHSDIQYIRQKDITRLQQSSPSENVRLSNSCPNLGKDESFVSTDTEFLEAFESPSTARSRRGFVLQGYEDEFPDHLDPFGVEDHSTPHPVRTPHPQHEEALETTSDSTGEEDEEESDEDDRGSSPSRRPHSWHSVEKLNESKPDVIPKADVISHKRSQSYQGNELLRVSPERQVELTPEEKAEQADTIASPAVRRVRQHRNNNSVFAVVGQENRALKVRSLGPVMASVNNNNNAVDADRRFTFSEGTLPPPTNFDVDEDSPSKRGKPPPPAVPPKPQVPLKPDGQPSKNKVSRKISFLTKMRGSQRPKVKKPGDSKNGASGGRTLTVEDNLTENKDKEAASKEGTRDFSWRAVKNKPKKGQSSSNANRTNSMMINKQLTNYGNSLPATTTPFFAPDGRVHGLPVRPGPAFRPNSTYETGSRVSDSTDGRFSRFYKDDGDSSSIHSGSRTPPHLSHHNTVSGSIESIDDAVDLLGELEQDPDLSIKQDEPEAWSVTVSKKQLDKMHKKNIKRQDNIFEFIQKERNFLTTLKIMQKIFAYGMLREVQCDQDVIEKMFPQIDEFVEYTSNFVEHLDQRQKENTVVSKIGDILVNQWSGKNGTQMMWLFGEFCSKQKEIVFMYKELMKNDKKFQEFISKCGQNPLTRRRDIPGCILLVTQRITKYPVILKTLIDNSSRKEHKADVENLNKALELVTDLIKKVDKQVLEYEKKMRVTEIYQKMESKTFATYKDGRKFFRDDFYTSIPKLLQVDTLQWRCNNQKRAIEIVVVLFKDVLVFVQENNQRYTFASVGPPAAVPLYKLLVREKAGEDRVLFLLSASSSVPEMYELEFQSPAHSKNWMQWIRKAADEKNNANPGQEEDDGASYQNVEEQRLLEQKWTQADQIVSDLEKKDRELNEVLQEKMKKFKMLAKVIERSEATANMRHSYPTYLLDSEGSKSRKLPEGTPTLLKAIEQLNKLSQAICGPGGLKRDLSRDEGSSPHVSQLPKRSETFGGFDNGKEPPSPRTKFATIGSKSSQRHDRSGTAREVTSFASETHSGEESPASNSGQQGVVLSPTPDQISALAQLTHLLNEYVSIATQQDTHVQKMSLKLMQNQTRRGTTGDKFLADEARRNQAKQSEMEQDLTKREVQLKSEKDQWTKEHKKQQRVLEAEKQELSERMEKFKRDEEELERTISENRRAKEDIQRQLARLREQQRKLAHDQGVSHSASYPSALAANKNNSNSAGYYEDATGDEYSHSRVPFVGYGLADMPAHMSKSHSSLEGELGEAPASRDSQMYGAGDYPRTFPGGGKKDQVAAAHQPQSVAAPAGQAVSTKPLHLQFSAANQVVDHMLTPQRSLIPNNLEKTKHGSHQVIPSKLKGLAGSQSSQPTKPSSGGLKGRLPFGHKKGQRPANSSSDLLEPKTRSNTLTLPNQMKHSKSDTNMDVSRARSTSSPNPALNLNTIDSDQGLERSNSASSNSSKEGADKSKKGKKRRSWGLNEKPGEKNVYQV